VFKYQPHTQQAETHVNYVTFLCDTHLHGFVKCEVPSARREKNPVCVAAADSRAPSSIHSALASPLSYLREASVHVNCIRCYVGQETDCSQIPRDFPVIEETSGILKTKLRGLSPRANYTDLATAACRPS
jgi:hypothetical protein